MSEEKSNLETETPGSAAPAGTGDGAEILPESKAPGSLFSIRKDLIFILAFVLLIFGLYLSPAKSYVEKLPELSARIQQTGFLAPLIFMLAVCVLVCAGVPRLLLCPIGGMAFGVFWGLIYCVAGTMLAYYIVFLFIRWGGGGFVNRHFPKIKLYTRFIRSGGIPAVILARQLPVHGMVINLMLGLSRIRHRDFLIGTAIGLFPEAIPFTIIGKGAKQGSIEKSIVYIVAAIIVLAALWLAVKIWSKRKSKS